MKKMLCLMIVLGACAKDKERSGTPLPTAGVGTEASAGAPASGGTTAPPLEPGQEAAGMPPGHPPIGDDSGGDSSEDMPAGHPAVDGSAGAAPGMPAMEGGGKVLADRPDGTKQLGGFAIAPPKDWKERPTKSSMRAAEWSLPGKGAEDAELVVYYFGQGGAGGVDANLDRWLGQFQQADGKSSKDVAKIEKTTIDGRAATLVAVEGRYVAAVTPGASETMDKAAWQMLGAIVEGADGPYYFKLIGPKATVEAHGAGFKKMISGLKAAK